MRPWEIAQKSWRSEGGLLVDVEHATDEEFQAFIESAGIPVDDNGIAEWSFDDRIGVINHAMSHGLALPFIDEAAPKRQRDVPARVQA